MSLLRGGFKGGRDECVESFGWSIPVECFAWSSVEAVGDVVVLVLGELGEVGSFGQVLTEQSVPVLVGAALPR